MSRRTPCRAPSCRSRAAGRGPRTAALLAVFLFAVGCMEANPLPSPGSETPSGRTDDQIGGDGGYDPRPDEYSYIRSALTFVSSLPPGEADGTVIVLGAPGATSEGEAVRVVVEDLNYRRDVLRGADGWFAAEIQGVYAGLDVTLTLLVAGADQGGELKTKGDPLELTVGTIAVGEAPAFFYDGDDADDERDPEPAGDSEGAYAGGGNGLPSEDLGFVAVTAPDADGIAHVRSAALGITPYAVLLVLNVEDGRSYAGQADNSGAVDVPVSAQVGDDLMVFAAKPTESTTTTQAITLIVPGAR